MNAPQKQFSLNRAASRKQIPIRLRGWGIVLLFVNAVVFCSALPSLADDNALQFEGHYEYQQSPPSGEPLVERAFFRAELTERGWRIRTAHSPDGMTNDWGAYNACASDGEFLYRLTSIGPGPRDNPQDKGNPVQKTASIRRETFPAFDLSHTTFIWLALASKPYFEKQGFIRSRPAWFASIASYTDPRGLLATTTRFLDGSGNYFKEIRFLSDGNAFIDIPNPPAIDVRYPEPFDKGFVKALYQAKQGVSSDGIIYPAEFELIVNDPISNARSTNDLRASCRLVGTVTTVRKIPTPDDIRPETVGLMRIIDDRKPRQGAAEFQYVSRGWKNEKDPELKTLATIFNKNEEQFQSTLNFRRNMIIGFLVLSTLAFWFIVLAKRRQTKRTQ